MLHINDVTVVDVTAEVHLRNRSLVMDGTQVAWTGERPALPAQLSELVERDVDCRGWYALPLLGDAHAHVSEPSDLDLYAGSGVGFVRHMAGSAMHLRWSTETLATTDLTPKMLTVSPIVDGPLPNGDLLPQVIPAPGRREAPAFVDRLARLGYAELKTYSNLTADQHAYLNAAARQVGLPTTGHCPRSLSFAAALAAGQRSFEHLTAITNGMVTERPAAVPAHRDRLLDRLDERKFVALARRLADSGAVVCPTLVTWAGDDLAELDRYLPRELAGDLERCGRRTPQALLRLHEVLVGHLNSAGVRLLAGTDAPAPGILHGRSLLREIEMLAGSGLTHGEALAAATVNVTEHLGIDQTWPPEAGRRSAVLLVPGDPLRDLSVLRKPVGVVVNGRYFGRAELSARLSRRERVTRSNTVPDSRPESPHAPGSPTPPTRRGILRETRGGVPSATFWFEHWHRPDGGWTVREAMVNARGVRRQVCQLVIDPDGYLGAAVVVVRGADTSEDRFLLRRRGDGCLLTVWDADRSTKRLLLPGRLCCSERLSLSWAAVQRSEGTDPWSGPAFDVEVPSFLVGVTYMTTDSTLRRRRQMVVSRQGEECRLSVDQELPDTLVAIEEHACNAYNGSAARRVKQVECPSTSSRPNPR